MRLAVIGDIKIIDGNGHSAALGGGNFGGSADNVEPVFGIVNSIGVHAVHHEGDFVQGTVNDFQLADGK